MIRTIIKKVLRIALGDRIVKRQFADSRCLIEFKAKDHLNIYIKKKVNYEFSKLIKEFTSNGELIFDVGANIGLFSIQFSDWVGQSGRVVAFEPDPTAIEYLKSNIALNSTQNITVVESALSAFPETKNLFLDSLTGGRRNSFIETESGNFNGETISTQTTTLDQAIENYGIPDLIKIDIEGFEEEVFKGVSNLYNQTIYCLELRNLSQNPILDKFTESGFMTFLLKDSSLEILNSNTLKYLQIADILFVHPDNLSSLSQNAREHIDNALFKKT